MRNNAREIELYKVAVCTLTCTYFCYIVEQVRLGPGGAQKVPIKPTKPKLFLTDGTDHAIHGVCVYFIRANISKTITHVNINNVSVILK